jgi:GNAT superfamily N-acetyltransferase
VGKRVVVRRIVRGESGPTGGPAMTDLLGVMTTWTPADTTVRAEDGRLVTIALADIVSGKPVPPRPSVRHRATPREAHLRCVVMWPDVETEPLGDWLLRSGGPPAERPVARANSVLAMGDPGVTLPEAAERVVGFYAHRGRPAWAQVEVGGAVDLGLTGLGWRPARPGEADTSFEIASVARVLRNLSGVLHGPVEVTLTEEGPRLVATVAGADGPAARGRAAVDGDWVGLHDLWTDPAYRRRGLSSAVAAHLLDAAAARGALTAHLQVRLDNPGALALYERLGFAPHHSYRYLTP